jgi:serine phosphatase RsbU (regulator of sigma subunit)
MLKYPVILFLLLNLVLMPGSFAQTKKLDSLTNILVSAPPDSVFVRTAPAFQYTITQDTIPANKTAALKKFLAHEQRSLFRRDFKECARANIAIAHLYEGQLIQDSTLYYLFKSMEYLKVLGDLETLAGIHYRMARIYFYKENPVESNKYINLLIQYYEKAADKNSGDLAKAYMLKAVVVQDIDDSLELAGTYYLKAIEMAEKNNAAVLGVLYNNYGEYLDMVGAPIAESFSYFDKAMDHAAVTGDSSVIAYASYCTGKIYFKNKKYAEAIQFTRPMVNYWYRTNRVNDLLNAYDLLYQCYEGKGDFKNMAFYLKKKVDLSDSLTNLTNSLNLAELDEKFKLEKQDKELLELKQKGALKQLENEKQENRNFQLMIGIGLSLVLGIFLLYAYFSKQKTNKLLKTEKKLVEVQNKVLEEKNKEILDSITYAKRIQDAILPAADYFKTTFHESFVFYKPKDIVAGDFYWLYKKDNLTFLAVCDCTGHGVPGALVSLVCSNSLERSVNEFDLRSPAEILDKTRELVKNSFQGSNENVNDGMDICLICIPENRTGDNIRIQYAGANNPAWYFEDGVMKELKPDKQPVGNFVLEKPFTNKEIEVRRGSMFYLFSDGYADQFGGPDGKKFKYKKLSEFLSNIVNLPDLAQKEKLETEFNLWRGELEQVDDICLIGVKIV